MKGIIGLDELSLEGSASLFREQMTINNVCEDKYGGGEKAVASPFESPMQRKVEYEDLCKQLIALFNQS